MYIVLPVNRKGRVIHTRPKQNVLLPQVQFSFTVVKHFTFSGRKSFWTEMNEVEWNGTVKNYRHLEVLLGEEACNSLFRPLFFKNYHLTSFLCPRYPTAGRNLKKQQQSITDHVPGLKVVCCQTGQSRIQILCFKLCLSSMPFLCTIHLKRLIAVKKKKNVNAVICEKKWRHWPK